MLVAIDTSAGTSVAVVGAEAPDATGSTPTKPAEPAADAVPGASVVVLAERKTDDTRRHAEVVGRFIADALADAGVRPDQLTGVVAGMGPGPFTGLRVGIAAARVFALGAGVPVIPVVSHDAIAFERYASGQGGQVLVVTDARRRELYWSAYDGTDEAGLPMRVAGPALCKPDELPENRGTRVDAAQVSAGALGRLAALLIGNRRPLADDEPLYLRSPDVTLSPRKRVS